jgi:hypothetical protein
MKRQVISLAIAIFIFPSIYLFAQKKSDAVTILTKQYNLVPRHSKDTQYFEMISRMDTHALDGTLETWDIICISVVFHPMIRRKEMNTVV